GGDFSRGPRRRVELPERYGDGLRKIPARLGQRDVPARFLEQDDSRRLAQLLQLQRNRAGAEVQLLCRMPDSAEARRGFESRQILQIWRQSAHGWVRSIV